MLTRPPLLFSCFPFFSRIKYPYLLYHQISESRVQNMAPLLPRQTTNGNPSATAAPPTDTNIDARADIYSGGSHNGLTHGQIGAIIGSIVGFTLFVLLLLCCSINRRREQRQRYRHRYHYHERSSSGSSSSGGSEYRGRPVRKPPAARMRRNVTVVDRDGVWDDGHGGYAGGWKRERERIPGGPKWPTYRAIPIPNPRKNPNLRRQL